jgi:ribosomal protein L32
MPQSAVRNDGAGPYAVFVCEKCRREFRSQPAKPDNAQLRSLGEGTVGGLLHNIPVVGDALATSATTAIDAAAQNLQSQGADLLGGLLHNIPVVGDALASSVAATDPRRAQMLTPAQLNAAWQEVQVNFRECPTCRQIVCAADFDDASGYCRDHRPGAAPGAQPAGYGQAAPYGQPDNSYGQSNAYGQTASYGQPDNSYGQPAAYGGAVAAGGAAAYGGASSAAPAPAPTPPAAGDAAAMARCPNDGTLAPAGTKFCPNCGTAMVPPKPAVVAGVCPNCGTETKGAKFCPNCGTKQEPPAPAPSVCPNCGTETKGARFCPNCGTKVS